MKIPVKQLWKVPAFCIAAGYISFYVYVFFVSRFGITELPDGSYTASKTVTTIFSILLFLATMGVGCYLFRSLTRKEVFLSASILVTFHLVLQTLQLLSPSTTFQIGIYLTYANEWCRILSTLIYAATKNLWIGAFAVCFSPYIFVLTKKA